MEPLEPLLQEGGGGEGHSRGGATVVGADEGEVRAALPISTG